MTDVLIISDMDGITGIERFEQCVSGHPEYDLGVNLMNREVNSVAEAALEGGASRVSAIDWHGSRNNLDAARLIDQVELIPKALPRRFDVAFLLGFHTMASDRKGFASHTFSHGMQVEANGRLVGKLALVVWWLGENGIPTALVSGDEATADEANSFFPELQTHTVKRARSWGRAECIPPETSFHRLSDHVTNLMEQRSWRTWRHEHPVDFRIQLEHPPSSIDLIPWMSTDEEGWYAGQVATIGDLINVTALIQSLLRAESQRAQLSSLATDPIVQKRLHEELLRHTAEIIHHADEERAS